MYGIVNKAIQDLVVTSAGEQVWAQVRQQAGLNNIELDVTENYDDQISLDLVGAASRILGMSVDTLLFEFGHHWVRYTNSEGWSSHFKMTGDSLIQCLIELDEVHIRVKDAMPEGCMPLFSVSESGEDFYLDYFSTRKGFAPMVMGILKGLCEQFEESWDITHLPPPRHINNCERFLLKRATSAVGDELQSAA